MLHHFMITEVQGGYIVSTYLILYAEFFLQKVLQFLEFKRLFMPVNLEEFEQKYIHI